MNDDGSFGKKSNYRYGISPLKSNETYLNSDNHKTFERDNYKN